jgi:Zn-dependent protease
MSMDMTSIGAKVGIMYVPFLFALCFHEFAHGFVAKLRGDNTAEQMGRLSMNPLVHVDWIGTVALPLMSIIFGSPIFFGWAKPVPVNYRNLKNFRTDLFWIALAGPLSNIFLAIVGAFLIGVVVRFGSELSIATAMLEILKAFILTNLFLAIFNIIPLHPLDGGKVIARFLPAEINYKLEQNEQMTSIVLMMLVFTGALGVLRYPVIWGYEFLIKTALGGLL